MGPENFFLPSPTWKSIYLAKWDYFRSVSPTRAVRYPGLWMSALEIISPAMENFCAERVCQLNKSRHERMAAAIVQVV